MDTSLLSKGAVEPVKERAKPTLITVGDEKRHKVVTSDFRFHADLLADYTIQYGRDRFIPVGEAASVCFGANTPRSKDKIRKRLSKLATELKERGFRLVVEGQPVTAFKVYTGAEIEKQYLQNKHGYWEARAQRAEEWRDYLGEAIS